jgi:PHD/YefM family antitoxin component YafN of YafNO toxin-antitoxin module
MLIPTVQNTRNITDFRTDPNSILEFVQGKDDPLYLFRGSEPKAVVLDITEYARLREALENYQDFLLISEIASDPARHEGTPLEKIIKKYNINVNNNAQNNLPSQSRKKAR